MSVIKSIQNRTEDEYILEYILSLDSVRTKCKGVIQIYKDLEQYEDRLRLFSDLAPIADLIKDLGQLSDNLREQILISADIEKCLEHNE